MITTESICRLLNELVELDPVAMSGLIGHRVPCLKSIEGHPSVIVGDVVSPIDLGWLGILGGIVGRENRIAMHEEPDGSFHFSALTADEIARIDGGATSL